MSTENIQIIGVVSICLLLLWGLSQVISCKSCKEEEPTPENPEKEIITIKEIQEITGLKASKIYYHLNYSRVKRAKLNGINYYRKEDALDLFAKKTNEPNRKSKRDNS